MTIKQEIDERAKVFARQVITEEFKQAASDELISSVAKKVSRAMPIRVMSKMVTRQLQAAE